MANDETPRAVPMISLDTYAALFDPSGARKRRASVLMQIIGLEDLPRVKDGWVERVDGETQVVIYARPGKDKECYCEYCAGAKCYVCLTQKAREHPNYVRDVFDTYDPGYAQFHFHLPEGFPEVPEKFIEGPIDTNERWKTGLEALKLDPDPYIPPGVAEVLKKIL